MESFSSYFTDELLFDFISGYLQISDLLNLAQTNRVLQLVIQQRCKRIIKNHNLTLIPSKTAIHQMRFYFDRCLTIYRRKEECDQIKGQKMQKQKQKGQRLHNYTSAQNSIDRKVAYSLQLTIQNPFKFKTITYFQVGVQYTAYLTIDNEAYIFKTSALVNLNRNKKSQLIYEKRLNVIQIRCKSQQVTYLKQNGQVYQIYGEKNSQKLLQKEELLNWCQHIEIQKIQASFNYTVFKPKKTHILYEQFLNYVFGYEIDVQKIKETEIQTHMNQVNYDKPQKQKLQAQHKTTLVLLNNISLKYYLIQFQKDEKITQIAVGNRQTYFLNQDYQCFVCYFEQQANNQNGAIQQLNPNKNHQYNKIIKAKSFHHFADKSIIKIASGYNFYIALERNIHDVSKWTTQQVSKWVRDIGFGQFAKIFGVQKVDGKKLLTIDKNYMYSSLGITKPNMQQKFVMLLEEITQNKNKEDTLYGWGKNQNGQLGYRNANFIKQPQKIKLPTILKQNEHVDSIFCGWYETFIRTQKGRVYRTVNYEKRKKGKDTGKDEVVADIKNIDKNGFFIKQAKKNYDPEQGYDSENENQRKKNTNRNEKGNNKNKRKYTQELLLNKDSHHKKFQEGQKWSQCELGKAFFVQGYKDILFYIQCPSQKNFEPTKEKKLRTAKMVLNKIMWALDAQQKKLYKVGYMDKDMGLIQTTILELKTFDYNQNRIRYIKRASQIVWDRDNKIDHSIYY